MTISQIRRQSRLFPHVRPGWVQKAFKQRGTSAKPGSSLPLLSPSLAERRVPNQRLACVCPLVRMRMLAIVPLQPCLQTRLEIHHAGKHPPTQKPPRQDAEEQFHLVEPRRGGRSEVQENLPVSREKVLNRLALVSREVVGADGSLCRLRIPTYDNSSVGQAMPHHG